MVTIVLGKSWEGIIVKVIFVFLVEDLGYLFWCEYLFLGFGSSCFYWYDVIVFRVLCILV